MTFFCSIIPEKQDNTCKVGNIRSLDKLGMTGLFTPYDRAAARDDRVVALNDRKVALKTYVPLLMTALQRRMHDHG